MEDQIIPIEFDDILDNYEEQLKNSNIFKNNENLESINCYIFYLYQNKIQNTKKYEIDIDINTLKKEQLLSIVLNNNKIQNKKYDLIGIYKYEIDIKEDKIKDFCLNTENYDFLTQYTGKIRQDIKFKPCIQLFNDSNSIFLFFKRKSDVQPVEQSKQPEEPEQEKINSSKNKTKKRVKFDLHKNQVSRNNKTLRNRT